MLPRCPRRRRRSCRRLPGSTAVPEALHQIRMTRCSSRGLTGSEALGDMWGRAIRYGGEPEEPDWPVVAGGDGLARADNWSRGG